MKPYIKPKFSVDTESPNWPYTFAENLAAVTIGNKAGFTNCVGEVSISQQFEETYRFKERLALVKKEDSYGFITPSDVFKIAPKYHDAISFSNGLAAVQTQSGGTWGFMGTMVIPQEFSCVHPFSEGVADV